MAQNAVFATLWWKPGNTPVFQVHLLHEENGMFCMNYGCFVFQYLLFIENLSM